MGVPLKADELFAAWSRNSWKNIYLFAGAEEFLIDQAIAQARAHWLPNSDNDFQFERFNVDDASVNAVIEACRTSPFMGGIKVVRADNVGMLSVGDQERLVETLSTLTADIALILVWGKEWKQRDDLRKPIVESVLQSGQVVVFWPLFPEQALRWTIARAQRPYRKTLSEEAAAWLLEQQGENLQLLDQELAKCAMYVGQRPSIELDDVQASFGYEKASSPFDWLTAIRRRDSRLAARILENLLGEGEEPIKLLALTSRSVRDWLSAKNNGENPATFVYRFHIRRGEEYRFQKELEAWSNDALIDAVDACVLAEQSIKSGKEEPLMALTLLNLRLSGLQGAEALS